MLLELRLSSQMPVKSKMIPSLQISLRTLYSIAFKNEHSDLAKEKINEVILLVRYVTSKTPTDNDVP